MALVISISRLTDFFGKNSSSSDKYLKEKNIDHYLFTCDLVEYNFKDIYKTFDISYFSKNKNLLLEFADSKNLKDYETIEKSAKNLMIILIRRFKLRISFKKSRNFSREIIISDDYEFDPNILRFTDDLIKIAIVKDDYDKWSSSKLSNYDYIFTLDKDKIEKNKNIFVLKGETTFEHIKFIFNELYRRKLDKFYHFLRNSGFQMVFPKRKYYFKILNSEYFDEDWYRQTYDLKDNTDSVTHFLLIGHDKGNDPGPNFSTHEYYECNKDVELTGMNPLVHYEVYGRKENRIIHLSDIDERNYNVLSNSSYFDKKWYEDTYDIHDEDSVSHYLNTGFTKWYNPGPDFNTFEYYECNKDVKDTRMNPLLHYELYGRGEKRTIEFSQETHDLYYSKILDSPFFDSEWYTKNYEIGDADPVYHYLNIGFALGYNPCPEFSTREYYDCNPDVEYYGMNPLLHYELHGREEERYLQISELNKRNYSIIFKSSFFDEEWYKSTYDLDDDVDYVEHYLKEGYKIGYDPGPDFSNYEYYECNNDVRVLKMNPLVHYEVYGKKEKRPIKISKYNYDMFYNSILNSPYFDEEWYRSTYDIGDWDAVEHYFKIGYARGFNPGPDFSTNDYYDANPDVKEYGMNALVHYELYGRDEGRDMKK